MLSAVINVSYLVASVLFILGLKGLTHPRTAVRGNFLGAVAMLIAIVVTLLDRRIVHFEIIIAGLVVGSAIGLVLAMRVQMTAMPQLVAVFNGFGGGSSVFVATSALIQAQAQPAEMTPQFLVATISSSIVGAVTLTGSLVAFLKLQEFKFMRKVGGFTGQQVVNALLLAGALAMSVWVMAVPAEVGAYWGVVVFALLLGVLFVVPIGGADMPVVIALLNSYSGIAAAATGFVLDNTVLIISGSLVGASGIILTQIMCKAMNRSLANVLFAKLQAAGGAGPSADDVYGGRVKSTSADEVAMLLESAQRVVVVPGYGLAVSQAQHALRDLCHLLTSRGAEVLFGIHPVAGRMPGHMNVLLAEADIPYESLIEMDDINPQFESTDVVIVIGANDVVNPVARTDPSSPIAGMPILDVDKARTVVVVKRSLSPGFAGIPNPLFAADNCLMLFGDGKKALLELSAALKESAR